MIMNLFYYREESKSFFAIFGSVFDRLHDRIEGVEGYINESISDKDYDTQSAWGDPSTFYNRWKVKYFENTHFGNFFTTHIN